MAQEKGAVAVVAPTAEEKHLHAALPCRLMQGDHIRIAHAFQIDTILALNMREPPDTVPERRRTFKLQIRRRRFHLGRQALLDGRRFARQELLGFRDQGGVIGFRNPVHTWRGAALDLKQQARTASGIKHRIPAGPQQEHALQGSKRLVHRPDGRKRPPIGCAFPPFPPMLGDLRKGVVFRDDQPGIGFVIPEHDVEARPEALDEIGFQQQCLGLGPCGDHFERPGFKNHAPEPFRQAGDLGIGSDPLTE